MAERDGPPAEGAEQAAAALSIGQTKRNPFEVRGELRVVDSATVVCVRQASRRGPVEPFAPRFRRQYADKGLKDSPFLQGYLVDDSFEFRSGWEVLVGQSEVINWLRSTPSKLVTMRYPGEFKLAGGNVDGTETPLQAAKRELQEEFLNPAETQVPEESIFLRPLSVKQTRPIRSRSNVMHNFVAVAEENPWLMNLDVDEVNRALEKRRSEFKAFLKLPDCPYFDFSPHDKELISPEVYQLRWMPLEEAVENCLTSVLRDVFVNEWQREEMYSVARTRRDPLIMTGAVLVELETFGSLQALQEYCDHVDMEELRRSEQWLFDGMSSEEVEETFARRLGPNNKTNPSFMPLAMVARRRRQLARSASL